MAKIGILVMANKIEERGTRKNKFYDSFEWFGMRAVEKEISKKKHSVEYMSASHLDDYDFVLVSLTSINDIMNLVHEMPKKRKAKVIIGGQGVVNVKSYLSYFDIAVFGRAEGQINNILEGERPKNVLDLKIDPGIEKKYEYRQPQHLVEGENSVGCPYNCSFCQYSWTHKMLKKQKNYNSTIGKYCQEDDIRHLEINNGRYYVSAIDGVSQASRFRVNKNIKNEHIIEKTKEMFFKQLSKRISLKLFVICGYPWEKYNNEYLNELKNVFHEADDPNSKSKIIIHLLFTPFSPEPLTPMEMDKPDFYTDWRRELTRNYKLYFSDTLQVYIMQYINTPYRLFERVFINRASIDDGEILSSALIDMKFRKLKNWKKIRWLEKNIDLERFEKPEKKEWDYLYVPK